MDGVENQGVNNNTQHTTVVPKLRERPQTSQVTPANKVLQSMNERFNMKLIEHGTEFGVPESELPDPSCAFSMTQHNKKGAGGSKTPAEAVTRNSANYASSYQLKQKVATRPPSGVLKKLNNTLTNSTIVNSKGGITESQNKTEMRGSIALKKTRNTSR